MINNLITKNFSRGNIPIKTISKGAIMTIYGSAFTYGTYEGYNWAMVDWNNIKVNNIKMNYVETGVQYFHTSLLTVTGGFAGCIFLTLSPLVIPSYFIIKNIN